MALFKQLRTALYTNDLTQKDLARVIKKSESYIALRMSGKYPFTLADVYVICDYFEIDHNQIATYFPPNGKPRAQTKGGSSHKS